MSYNNNNNNNNNNRNKYLYKKDDGDGDGDVDNDDKDFFEDATNGNHLDEENIEEEEEEVKFEKVREGWLINMQPSSYKCKDTGIDKSSLELFFIKEDASSFKAWIQYNPYFYIMAKEGHHLEVESYLKKVYDSKISSIEILDKEDMDLENHLSGLTRKYLKVKFHNVQHLLSVRSEIMPIIKKNKQRITTTAAYEDPYSSKTYFSQQQQSKKKIVIGKHTTEYILDIREYDVTYYVRCAIDLGIFVGLWYQVTKEGPTMPTVVTPLKSRVDRPDPRVLAFDIECTKLPLKFPDASFDEIIMISYMLDRQGYLIVNREIVSQDIDDFEYTPKPEFEGPFTVFNEPNEQAVLKKFFSHVKKVKPHIFVTYNGDFFDWPFVEARARHYGIDMYREIGFRCDREEYRSRTAVHMDAMCWVKRDSYLPHGSHRLKEVAKAKLQYNPLEIDPELMLKAAQEEPEKLANYSVSDAVATYYLYMVYVHPFIFSLCNIIPMNPDDVLRKGSGTLCEALLMTQAFRANVIYPNKHYDDHSKMYKGHLIDEETYVGGHVECLESGVFRSDIPTYFDLGEEALQFHIDNVDQVLKIAMHEGGINPETATNLEEIKADVVSKFSKLLEKPKQQSSPLIYHLDVSAMYPNIILTNKLQPTAMVNEEFCATCVYNKPESQCQRTLNWEWRGDYSPSNAGEYRLIVQQLEMERFGPTQKPFMELDDDEKSTIIKKRLKDYSKKVYKKTHIVSQEIRSDTVCMRENSFYIDTVREFRDRRYIFKGHHRDWKIQYDQAMKESGGASSVQVQKCQAMVVLYESLQLAHKCILNSFYGYVMRKGARWYSMQMAGIVTHTGSNIIKEARQVVEKLGRPLEIDTDGIWCILPSNFPENYTIKTTDPSKKFTFSYLCSMLNEKVSDRFTNKQYQDFNPETKTYTIRDECSILFECDGPYRCMVIPTSKEKDVKLKKRYAVFNKQGAICELKGFEIKRRGELKLIKDFQQQVFKHFLGGTTLEGCYLSVGEVANKYLDIIDSHGDGMEDRDLIELITESSNMSRKLEEYGNQKSSAISTAKKIGEFLGQDMIKDKGVTCRYIISCRPTGAAVTERTIPVDIFNADPVIRDRFLRLWSKASSSDIELRDLIDWNYYRTRLSGVIQKIITIPAALQSIENPVPRVVHPDWVIKELRKHEYARQQTTITSFFNKIEIGGDKATETDTTEDTNNNGSSEPKIADIEDAFEDRFKRPHIPIVTTTKSKRSLAKSEKGQKKIKSFFNAPTSEDLEILTIKPPSFDKEFDKWLEFSKKRWRVLRQRKKSIQHQQQQKRSIRFQQEDEEDEDSMVLSTTKKPGFFKSQTDMIREGIWQIISIDRETNEPGLYTFWTLIDEQIIPLKIEVKRSFYINSFVPDPYEGAEKSSIMIPPRSKPRLNLYKTTIAESEYKEQAKELNNLFTNPVIEGAYETKISPELNAIITVGCMASLSKGVKPNSHNRYTLEDIEPRPEKQYSYLSAQNFNQLFLYHNSKNGNDGIFALFRMHTNTATVIYANPYSVGNKRIDISQKVLQPLKDQFPELQLEFQQVSSMTAAYKSMNQTLQDYSNLKSGATILLLQTQSPDILCKDISMLRSFPRIQIPFHEQDSQYSPFNWEVNVIRPLPTRFNDAQKLWIYYVNMARYSNVPVGNMHTDSASFISDILFSRALREQNHILWTSDSNCPDLGGSEEDDTKFYEEIISTQINEPNCYNSVCFELDLSDLATNTILESTHLAEIEGIIGTELNSGDPNIINDLMVKNNTTNNGVSFSKVATPKNALSSLTTQMGGCEKEFNILRHLVSKWKLDLVSGSNTKKNAINSYYSKFLLLHFYRWISSTNSGLYDPMIHRTLHTLMKKIFLQLIFEFKKLGAKIVYGDFHKIIICSDKSTIEDAQSYCNYIITVVKKKDLFSWISIKPTKFWFNLLWMDTYNYSGILYHEDNDSDEQEEREFLIPNGSIDTNWNIAEYLPSQLQNSFLIIVSDFIHKLHLHRDQINELFNRSKQQINQKNKKINENGGNNDASTTDENEKNEDKGDESEETEQTQTQDEEMQEDLPNTQEFKKLNLRQSSTWNEEEERLSRENKITKWEMVVDSGRISNMLQSFLQNNTSLEFPQLPGSHLEMLNPPLEFIKFVCHVLSIDKSIHSEVQRLRKTLLRMIKVREFSEESKFKDPCISYTINDVICSFCHSCRDLDLLRVKTTYGQSTAGDTDLLEENLTCKSCKNQYCKNTIEATLVEIIQRKSLTYQLQDVKCSKCGNIKADTLSEICSTCSGQWQCNESNDIFSKDLTVFQSIAKNYKFNWLLETVEGLRLIK
eukprot:gene7732-9508_t